MLCETHSHLRPGPYVHVLERCSWRIATGVKKASIHTCHIYTPAPGVWTRQCGPPAVQLAHLEFKVGLVNRLRVRPSLPLHSFGFG